MSSKNSSKSNKKTSVQPNPKQQLKDQKFIDLRRNAFLPPKPEMEYPDVPDLHPQLPDFPSNQGELFFECTLFLYSVLALFLQYLNLYKTLWWLPKSYWPTSMKYYMINPYLLSCIGLMLGIRVTKCFWNNLTEMFLIITGGKESIFWTVVEYGILKAPICTIVFTSFLFSFTKVYLENGFRAFLYFSIPFVVYLILLWIGFNGIQEDEKLKSIDKKQRFAFVVNPVLKLASLVKALFRSSSLINLETAEHVCTGSPRKIRAEVDKLAQDFSNRLKYSILAGFSTAYLSIYLPMVFLPQKSLHEMFLIITGGKESIFWTVVEYGILKAPICTIVFTSFLFSFTKVYLENGFRAFLYFSIPFVVYLILLWIGFNGIQEDEKLKSIDKKQRFAFVVNPVLKLASLVKALFRSSSLINLETAEHVCTGSPRKIRAEVDKLAQDFSNRLKYSILAGFSTAYLSIYLPMVFLPQKSLHGFPQFILINNFWITKLFLIVSFTSFSVYFIYLLPLNYLNLLKKCAFHLGRWEQIDATPTQEIVKFSEEILYPSSDKLLVQHNGQVYKIGDCKNSVSTVAIPGDTTHFLFFRIANDPVKFVTGLCIFEFIIILFQFLFLILASDWQHIVTLVLLMFANYLLLGKIFKDRVVIGRIYNPSGEDVDLWKQVRNAGKVILS
uniref:Transmembrane protein n=2 Tax=Panagrolaimus sp. JU765 TaxID=591449 RepID=A0AC34RCW2_9BILA